MASRLQSTSILLVALAMLCFVACFDSRQTASQDANSLVATNQENQNAQDVETDTPDAADESSNTSDQSPDSTTDVREDRPSDSSQEGYFDEDWKPAERQPEKEVQTIEIPKTWKRLGEKGFHEIWIDTENKECIAAGYICQAQGGLEMFACPRGTKEHESVMAINAKASQIHATLVALDCDPGKPVQWHPEYVPVSGPVLDIEMMWKDRKTGKVIRRDSREMVVNVDTGEKMTQEWVFGGSQIYKDPHDGVTVYYGDGGELICLSNFSTATIDVNVKSTDANSGLMFGGNPKTIPEPGTKVYIVIRPTGKVIKPVAPVKSDGQVDPATSKDEKADGEKLGADKSDSVASKTEKEKTEKEKTEKEKTEKEEAVNAPEAKPTEKDADSSPNLRGGDLPAEPATKANPNDANGGK